MSRSPAQRFFQIPRVVAIYERVRESAASELVIGVSIAEELDEAVSWVERVPAGGRVLDLACGQGTFSVGIARARPDLQVTGADLSEAQLTRARARARREGTTNATFETCDATAMKFDDARFDAVTFMGGLHQIPDHAAVAREVARVARPGATFGGAFFSMEGAAGRVRRGLESISGVVCVDGDDWGRTLERAGFDGYCFDRRSPVWGVFRATRRT